MKNNNKGFTLIELLVVIAIIGLLSSVVLASLNSARNKAKDAAVKSGVDQMRKLMELNISDYNSYDQLSSSWVSYYGACSTRFSGNHAAQGRAICESIYQKSARPWGDRYGYYSRTGVLVSGGPQVYSIMVPLHNGKWYCAGSSGRSGEYSSYTNQPGCYNNP